MDQREGNRENSMSSTEATGRRLGRHRLGILLGHVICHFLDQSVEHHRVVRPNGESTL